MKNTLFKIILLSVMTILYLFGVTQANDSISVPVSVTIPAIPGINAPPFPEKAPGVPRSQETDNAAYVRENPNQTNNPIPTIIQQETLKQTAQGTIILNTIYSR